MGNRKFTTPGFILPFGAMKPMDASMPFSRDPFCIFTRSEYLDIGVIHGDGTTTVAKKGGDNLGFSGHKHLKGDKVIPFCDRNCNVIAPFVAAPGNRNESPLLKEALPQVTRIAKKVGLDLNKTIVSLDGIYDSRSNRKAIFNRGMIPNIPANP